MSDAIVQEEERGGQIIITEYKCIYTNWRIEREKGVLVVCA